MSDVIIEPSSKKKTKLGPGDFVFYKDSGVEYVGMIYQRLSVTGVIWSNGETTVYDANMHIPFVGMLTIR